MTSFPRLDRGYPGIGNHSTRAGYSSLLNPRGTYGLVVAEIGTEFQLDPKPKPTPTPKPTPKPKPKPTPRGYHTLRELGIQTSRWMQQNPRKSGEGGNGIVNKRLIWFVYPRRPH